MAAVEESVSSLTEGECSTERVSSGDDLPENDLPEKSPHSEEPFFFDNEIIVFPNIPGSEGLKHIKLFTNYIHFFPVNDFPELEELEVRTHPLVLNSFLPRGKASKLKRLELHNRFHLSSASLPAEISEATSLESLTISHCSILSLGSHIDKLQSLLELDLSFNKIARIPEAISELKMLKTLKISNNKLVELPAYMSKLKALVTMDVSCNRITSLSSLDLYAMTSLRHLNVQFNKLESTGNIPEWLQCDITGQVKLKSQISHKRELSEDTDEGLKNDGSDHSEDNADRASKSRWKLKRHKLTTIPEKLQEGNTVTVTAPAEATEASAKDLSQNDNVEEMLDSGQTTSQEPDLNTEEPSRKAVSRKRDKGAVNDNTPSKRSKADGNSLQVSMKYRRESFCGVDDYLPDGFYDAGKDRPFVELDLLHREELTLDTREILLVDRKKDEMLESIAMEARERLATFLRRLKLPEQVSVELCIQLATLVSEKFGGSDNGSICDSTLRAALGMTSTTPLICLCYSPQPGFDNMLKRCNEAVNDAKRLRRSNVIPIGWLVGCGVCRHRAVLFKYLCDRSRPVIPCELIRGYLDNMRHAWNVVLAPSDDDGGAQTRMVVDACRPTNVRPETDPENFSRYIPLRRVKVQHSNDVSVSPLGELIAVGASGAKIQKCHFGQLPVAAKVRRLDSNTPEGSNYLEKWLSELRMYCAVGEHPNLVSFYGHDISYEPTPQMVVFMEYIKGGSLAELIESYLKQGHSFMPPDTALLVAESVARGLEWLHSRKIIHRDIKSSNILVDMESEIPVVKICDFDSSIPLTSSSSNHTCYLASYRLPLRVGTLRWVAPEILNASSELQYGLEADIWSFGCLVLELLTLRLPYAELDDSKVLDSTRGGERPSLTRELEEMQLNSQKERESLRLLVDMYESCTEVDPAKRPPAREVLSKLTSFRRSTDVGEE